MEVRSSCDRRLPTALFADPKPFARTFYDREAEEKT